MLEAVYPDLAEVIPCRDWVQEDTFQGQSRRTECASHIGGTTMIV